MQIVATVALVAAAALELTSAAPEGHLRLHLESTNTNAKAAEWQQCKWNDHTVACDSGLICAVQNDYYGQCVKKQAGLWGQCAGKNWTGSCVSGAKCEKKDDWYSQCVPDKSSSSGGIAEWQQCHWETYELACASGLQCAVENKWWGMCVKKQADLWGQCGGKNWSATCKSGKCVKKDDYYSQCQQ